MYELQCHIYIFSAKLEPEFKNLLEKYTMQFPYSVLIAASRNERDNSREQLLYH